MSQSARPRLAINGFGRIGRACARALFERGVDAPFELVAINELAALETGAYLTRHDSTHGRFPVEVAIDDKYLVGQSARAGAQSSGRQATAVG